MSKPRVSLGLSGSDSDTLGSISFDDNIGDGANSKDTGESDRDMTEDEVALMVKNALRKARRAMHSSSPFSVGDKSGNSGASSSINPSESKSSFGGLGTFSTTDDGNESGTGVAGKKLAESTSYTSETDVKSGTSQEDDLARRIEEEIHSARAFAEKVYYGKTTLSKENAKSSTLSKKSPDSSPRKTYEDISDYSLSRNISTNSGRTSINSGRTSVNSGRTSHTADTDPVSNVSKIGVTTTKRKSTQRTTKSPKATLQKDDSNSIDTSTKLPPIAPHFSSNSTSSPSTSYKDEFTTSKVPLSLALPESIEEDSSTEGSGLDDDDLESDGENDRKVENLKLGNRNKQLRTKAGDNVAPKFRHSTKSPRQVSPKNEPTRHKNLQIKTSDDLVGPSPRRSTSSPRVQAKEMSSTRSRKSDVGEPLASHRSSVPDEKHGSRDSRSLSRPTNSTKEVQPRNHRRDAVSPSNVHSPASVTSRSSALSPNNAMSPSSTVSATAKTNGAREPRQVEFRHPYPLPPPPVLPRSEDIIIAENSVKDPAFNVKWVEPKPDLLQLIQAAEDDSLARRSNACGALKVLASKDTNQARLCRTTGLLKALVTASMDDAIDSDALDARTRAVTTLLYLSEPKDNRIIVCKHPNVVSVLVKVIEEDTGEARLRACSALAMLAKTPQNRSAIANTDRLALALSDLMVINAMQKSNETTKEPEKGKNENVGAATMESRDDSTFRDAESRASSVTDDDGMLSNTLTETFSGTGTYTEDDTTHQDYYSESYSEAASWAEEDEGSTVGYSGDEESILEEEGVEMQISTLKKLNIENHSDFLARSQLSACATLTHLTKHCANAPLLCKNDKLLENILLLASVFDSPLHTRCIEMLCNFSRFPANNARLAAMPNVIETLLLCGKSKIAEDRMWAVRTIQNLCSDASSKVSLATGSLLSLLSAAAMRKDYDEQYAAVGALMNLSTEPGSIVPLTNTKTVVATLVHLAHSPNTPTPVRKIACDSLATIGLWLQTLASAGTVPEEVPFSPLPTHSATGWLRWES